MVDGVEGRLLQAVMYNTSRVLRPLSFHQSQDENTTYGPGLIILSSQIRYDSKYL